MILDFFLIPASPVLVLFLSAILLIVLETVLPEEKARGLKVIVALMGPILSILLVSTVVSNSPLEVTTTNVPSWLVDFQKAYRMNGFSPGFYWAISFFLILSLVFIQSFLRNYRELTEVFALLLFAGAGMMLLVSAGSLLMIFMGLELMSLPTYVLVGMRKDDLRSCEAALKYFLYGSFATVLVVLGITLIYGKYGTLDIAQITQFVSSETSLSSSTIAAFGLLLVGVGFKVGLVPFHLWLPDAYQGAPTPITAFMGSTIKLAGFALATRLFSEMFYPLVLQWSGLLAGFATLTILVGNLAALRQTDLKRLFAYSSISHAGTLFLGVIASGGKQAETGPLLYYLWIYGLLFLGTFGILSLIELHKKSLDINRLNGLGFQKPVLGLCLLIFTLSAAGIPPTAGFFAKYFIFLQAVNSGYLVWVVPAVLSSLIGVAYYLRVLAHLYMKDPSDSEGVLVLNNSAAFWGIVLCALAMIYFALNGSIPLSAR